MRIAAARSYPRGILPDAHRNDARVSQRFASDGSLRQHLDTRLAGMKTDRLSWWAHWREIADYMLPRRFKWLVTANQSQRGSPINQRIIDNTATIAGRTLGSGLTSGTASPARPWFRMTLDDEDLAESGSVKSWLDECTKRMLRVLAESNFYQAVATARLDLAFFGTSPMFIEENFDNVIHCVTPACGEYYLANNENGEVGHYYREFAYTMYQTAKKFGLKNCSPTVQAAIRTGGASLSQEIVICHAIEPNDEYIPEASGVQGKPFREVYWEKATGQDMILRIRGYHEWPVPCPRWETVGNDAYGRSTAMDALGDTKQLQVEQKRKAQAIDKQVNPPLVGHVSLKNEPMSVLPGGVSYVPDLAGVGLKPIYEVKPELSAMVEDIQDVRKRIRDAFFYDLFLMISQLETVRTATEIDARREEKLIQLGPVLERDQKEFQIPCIERVFGIMWRKGLLPPTPPELQGQNIKVEFVGTLAQMQKAAATAGIERVASFVGNIAAVRPEAMDKVDTDEAIDQYADLLGVSPKIIVPTSKLKKLRAARAQQAQQQMELQNSTAAAAGAKTLSETDTGGGVNALQKMLGNS